MTKQWLRAMACVSVVVAASGCYHIDRGMYATPSSVPMTADELAAAAMLDGPTWMPIPIRGHAGVGIQQLDLVGGTAYVIDADDTVHAIDATAGQHSWVMGLSRTPTRPVSVGPSHVAFISERHMTIATRDSGTLVTERFLDFAPSSGVALSGDSLFTGSWGDGYRLRTVSLFDGWPGWVYESDGAITSKPLVIGYGADQLAYFAANDNSVVALEPRTAASSGPGSVAWSTRTLGANTADLANDSAAIYVASRDHALYSMNRSVGTINWKWLGAAMPLTESPQIGDDTVYQPFGNTIAAIDKATGVERYRFQGAERFLTRVSGRDYFKLPGTAIAVVDAATGDVLAEVRSPLLEMVPSNPTGGALVFSDGASVFSLD